MPFVSRFNARWAWRQKIQWQQLLNESREQRGGRLLASFFHESSAELSTKPSLRTVASGETTAPHAFA